MTMIGIFAGLFMIVFFFVVVSIVTSGWRASRMVGKVLSMAEQELDRQVNDRTTQPTGPAASSSSAVSEGRRCEHCGSTLATGSQCPNCGARLS